MSNTFSQVPLCDQHDCHGKRSVIVLIRGSREHLCVGPDASPLLHASSTFCLAQSDDYQDLAFPSTSGHLFLREVYLGSLHVRADGFCRQPCERPCKSHFDQPCWASITFQSYDTDPRGICRRLSAGSSSRRGLPANTRFRLVTYSENARAQKDAKCH